MSSLFTFLFNHGFAVAVGVIPLIISLLLSFFATSWRRWLAIGLALVAGSIFAFELYSGSLEGNLTGLIWIISTPFVAVAIAILAAIEWSSRSRNYSDKNGASNDDRD